MQLRSVMKLFFIAFACVFCLLFSACFVEPYQWRDYLINSKDEKVGTIRIDSIKKTVTPSSLEATIYFKYLDSLKRVWGYYERIYMELSFYSDTTHQHKLGIGATPVNSQLGCTSNCANLSSGLGNMIFVDSMGVVTVRFRSVVGKDFSTYQAMDVDSARLVYFNH